jgi:Ca2+-binding EF-hand superfamily protein
MRTKSLSSLVIVASALLWPIASYAAPRGDADGDGKLSLGEFQMAAQKRLLRADKDTDGKLSLQEWLARPATAKAKHDPTKLFNRLDANKDGQLDAAEIEALAKRRFAALDKNSDGALSDEERPARKAAATEAKPNDQDGAAIDDDAEAPATGQPSAQ